MYQMHRYDEGIRAACKALELASKGSTEENVLHLPLDECYYNVGMGYLLKSEYDTAIELLSKALEYNPHNTMVLQYIEWLKSHQVNAKSEQTPASRSHQQSIPATMQEAVPELR